MGQLVALAQLLNCGRNNQSGTPVLGHEMSLTWGQISYFGKLADGQKKSKQRQLHKCEVGFGPPVHRREFY